MRVSFAENSVGFGLVDSSLAASSLKSAKQLKTFGIEPVWTDITPDYDPTGHSSELDIIQEIGLDVSQIKLSFEWRVGAEIDALQEYNASRRYAGLPAQKVDSCRTILSVLGVDLYVQLFVSAVDYDLLLSSFESFATWQNPKAFYGHGRLRLLNDGLYAALDKEQLKAFFSGHMPLYSDETISMSFRQNCIIPNRPDATEKNSYHRSQV